MTRERERRSAGNCCCFAWRRSRWGCAPLLLMLLVCVAPASHAGNSWLYTLGGIQTWYGDENLEGSMDSFEQIYAWGIGVMGPIKENRDLGLRLEIGGEFAESNEHGTETEWQNVVLRCSVFLSNLVESDKDLGFYVGLGIGIGGYELTVDDSGAEAGPSREEEETKPTVDDSSVGGHIYAGLKWRHLMLEVFAESLDPLGATDKSQEEPESVLIRAGIAF